MNIRIKRQRVTQRKLSFAMLRRKHACNRALRWFHAKFQDGCPVTWESVQQAAADPEFSTAWCYFVAWWFFTPGEFQRFTRAANNHLHRLSGQEYKEAVLEEFYLFWHRSAIKLGYASKKRGSLMGAEIFIRVLKEMEGADEA